MQWRLAPTEIGALSSSCALYLLRASGVPRTDAEPFLVAASATVAQCGITAGSIRVEQRKGD